MRFLPVRKRLVLFVLPAIPAGGGVAGYLALASSLSFLARRVAMEAAPQ